MKKYTKYLFLAIAVGFLTSCKVQKQIVSKKNGSGDLIGYADKNAFLDDAYKGWFTANYDNYNPDKAVISELIKPLKNVTITGFMGTWCGDSRRETPRFYKVLEDANFDFKKLKLITVNRGKKTPDNLQEGHNIIRVPTFIFYKNGKEIGRYVEYSRESLEKDILKIVTGKKYKHAYER